MTTCTNQLLSKKLHIKLHNDDNIFALTPIENILLLMPLSKPRHWIDVQCILKLFPGSFQTRALRCSLLDQRIFENWIRPKVSVRDLAAHYDASFIVHASWSNLQGKRKTCKTHQNTSWSDTKDKGDPSCLSFKSFYNFPRPIGNICARVYT